MTKFVLMLLMIGCLYGSLVFSQPTPPTESEPAGLDSDFLLRVWDTSDGLFPTIPRCITQTRDGYVWLASFDGVVRFDGSHAVTFSGKNCPGLPTPMLATLVHADQQHHVWAATSDGGLFSFDQLAWRGCGAAENWSDMEVVAIADAADGTLLVAGKRELLRFDGKKFTDVALPAALGTAPLQTAFFDKQEKLWIVSNRTAWRQDGAVWTQMLAADAIDGAVAAKDGGAWIATGAELCKCSDNRVALKLARPAGFQNDAVQLLEDFRGNLWVGGMQTGLRVWMADGRVLSAGRVGDAAPPQISWLFEDREHNVLAATHGAGLARFRPRMFENCLGAAGSLVGTMVDSICEEKPGQILVGTESCGLRRLVRDRAGMLQAPSADLLTAQQPVTSLLRLRDGTVLAAAAGLGLLRVEDNRTVPVASPIGNNRVRALFEDSRGRLWIGRHGCMFVRENGQFRSLPGDPDHPLADVRAFAEDRDGAVWAIGKQGLVRITNDRIETVLLPNLPQKVNLLSLHADAEGALWIGAESLGLVRYERGNVFVYTAAHALPTISIGAIIEENNWLWLAGDKGLVRVSRQSLDAVAAGRTALLELAFFNRGDGLSSDAFRRGYQPVATKTSDGRLWFATHKGAVSIQPSSLITPLYEPPATIEEVRAEKVLFPITPLNQDSLVIAADLRHLSIRCTTPSLSNPEGTRFRYELQGPQGQWHDLGTERLMRFQDLAPGRYQYRVWAIAADGRLVQPATVIGMTIRPFIWQTLWFRILAVLGLLGVGGGIAWRIQQHRIFLRDQQLRHQEERAKLEEQLHQAQKMEAIGRLAGGIAHDFNNLLTIIIGNTDFVKSIHHADPSTQAFTDDVLKASWRARDLITQILTFSRQHAVARTVVDIAQSLRDACGLLRAGVPTTIEMSVSIPDALPPILADASQIHRVVMNLGTNAAQAVGPSGGRIAIRAGEFIASAAFAEQHPEVVPGRYVRISVEDNGTGMSDATLKCIFMPFFTTKKVGQGTGLGLAVVHGIVEAHGGAIVVSSRPNAGSVFEIYLPVTDRPADGATKKDEALIASQSATILLIDDQADVLTMTRRMLEDLGYKVEAYADALQAESAFRQAPAHFDLVLTDFAMPVLNGVELAQQLWKLRSAVPIILYTGYGGSIGADTAKEMGFAGLLTKPFSAEALATAIASGLRRERNFV